MEKKQVLIGAKFPEFKANTTHGIIDFPNEYKNKWVVLFSHPGDFTPVCTTEFVAFNKRIEKFEKLNTKLIGHSIDQVFSHIKWTEWIQDNLKETIKFPIIADERGQIADMLSMIHPKASNTVRSVFIIDPKGILRALLHYPQELGRNIDEILRMVTNLQISDENKVAMPENWPNNEIIGNNVIIPPASNQQEAQKRKGADGCYDWWFCYKKL